MQMSVSAVMPWLDASIWMCTALTSRTDMYQISHDAMNHIYQAQGQDVMHAQCSRVCQAVSGGEFRTRRSLSGPAQTGSQHNPGPSSAAGQS